LLHFAEGANAMIDRFKTYFETLEGLSTEELDRSAEKLVGAEKRNVALVIAHIAEMSRRKGELERGYKNLFDYGVAFIQDKIDSYRHRSSPNGLADSL
jgi:hypothetical protein